MDVDLSGAVSLEEVMDRFPHLDLGELRVAVDDATRLCREEAARGDEPVTCRGEGCSGCCRGNVVVSSAELADIMPRIPQAAFDRVKADAASVLDYARRNTMRCPILDPDTSLCLIYEHRPLVCRAYQVVSPADDCFVGIGKTGIKEVKRLMSTHAVFAIYKNQDEEIELFVEMLNEAESRAANSEE